MSVNSQFWSILAIPVHSAPNRGAITIRGVPDVQNGPEVSRCVHKCPFLTILAIPVRTGQKCGAVTIKGVPDVHSWHSWSFLVILIPNSFLRSYWDFQDLRNPLRNE